MHKFSFLRRSVLRAALMAPLLRGTNPIVDGRKKDRTFVKRQLWLLFADFTAHASGRMIA